MTFDLLKIYQSDGVTWPGQQKDKDNDKEKHLLTYTVGDSWQSLFLWLEEKNEKKGQKERFQQNLLRESLATYNGVLVWHLDFGASIWSDLVRCQTEIAFKARPVLLHSKP